MEELEADKRAKAIARHEARVAVHVAPHVEREKAAESHAISYAQQAVKAILLLNGGALVAYPAFMDSARLSMIVAYSSWSLVAPVAVHALGLLLGAAAFALGFHYMATILNIWRLCAERETGALRYDLMIELGVSGHSKNDSITEQIAAHDVSARRLEWWAIRLFYVSAVLFVVGVGLGLWLLSIAGPLHIPDVT